MTDVTNSESAPEVTPHEDDTEDFATFEAKANAAPETVAAEDDDEPEGFDDTEDNADEPQSADAEDDDWDEIEWKGKKVKVPKGAAMMQADYTRKTQELAEQRKAVEATLTQVNEVSQAEQQAQAEYISIANALAEYDDIDWHTWLDQDPVTAQKARVDMEQLQKRASQVVGIHQNAQNQRLALAKQEAAKRLADGQRVLVDKIPGWGAEKAQALLAFSQQNYGFTPAELDNVNDPRWVIALNDAFQARQEMAKSKQRAKAEAVHAVKPAATLKGNAGPRGPKADTNDFASFERMAKKVIAAR